MITRWQAALLSIVLLAAVVAGVVIAPTVAVFALVAAGVLRGLLERSSYPNNAGLVFALGVGAAGALLACPFLVIHHQADDGEWAAAIAGFGLGFAASSGVEVALFSCSGRWERTRQQEPPGAVAG